MTRCPLVPESCVALLKDQVLERRYTPPRRSTTMSPVMVAVRPRTTAWAPSRLHGALRVQPLVAVASGDAYSVICTLADAAGASATRPPAPNVAAVAAARTDISFVFREWLIGRCLSGFAETDVVRYELRPSRRFRPGLADAIRPPAG